MYLGQSLDREDAGRDLLIPAGEDCNRSQLPFGHLYAARIEPVEGVQRVEPVPHTRWQGRWWEPCPKRTRQEDPGAASNNVINRKYRKVQEVTRVEEAPAQTINRRYRRVAGVAPGSATPRR